VSIKKVLPLHNTLQHAKVYWLHIIIKLDYLSHAMSMPSTQVGDSHLRLLRHLGVEVDYPESRLAAGQPMANADLSRWPNPWPQSLTTC
jgi:hypothetical protein